MSIENASFINCSPCFCTYLSIAFTKRPTSFWKRSSSILIGNQWLKSEGLQSTNLQSKNGCDNILNILITYEDELNQLLNLFTDTLDRKGTPLSYFVPNLDNTWDINWSSINGLNSDNNQLSFIAQSSDEITVELYNDSGSILTTSFKLDVFEVVLVIPNAFSPNDDGANDYWELDLSYYQNPKTLIYDRWGNLLYKSEDAFPRWDGEFDGWPINPGVYVYRIQYDDLGVPTVKTGYITVMR